MTTYGPFESGRPVLVLGHGAGAGEAHPWVRAVGTGLSDRRVTVVTFDFPYMAARKRVPDRAPVLEDAFRAVWEEVAARHPSARFFAGGKSMGGRIATQAAARKILTPAPAGFVCLGYPLHPPGKPETRRDAHLGALGAPILFLHGTRDPFGTPEEMSELAARLPEATVEFVEGGDHSLERSTDRKKSKVAALATPLDRAASWIQSCPMMP